jgi:hypothetical protein
MPYGPPIPGAPWARRQAPARAPAPAAPGTPGGPTIKQRRLVPRVPPGSDPRRQARFFDMVSELINSLLTQGYITETGTNPPTWVINVPPKP